MSPEETAKELLRRFGEKASPDTIAELFSEDVDWHVAGDLETVPWIGRKTGRKGVSEFWAQIQASLENKFFDVSGILSKGDRVVVVGELESTLRLTGRSISTEYVFDLKVHEGSIVRFRMLEDTYAVAQAFEQG